MIRLTNLADYAVVLMVEIARRAPHACTSEEGASKQSTAGPEVHTRVNAVGLSEATMIPAPTVSKILNALARAGLIISHRGHGGGVSMAAPASQVSLAAIVEAIEGPIALTQCAEGDDSGCSFDSFCRVKPHWRMINDAVRSAVDAVSLADVVANPAPAPAHSPAQKRSRMAKAAALAAD